MISYRFRSNQTRLLRTLLCAMRPPSLHVSTKVPLLSLHLSTKVPLSLLLFLYQSFNRICSRHIYSSCRGSSSFSRFLRSGCYVSFCISWYLTSLLTSISLLESSQDIFHPQDFYRTSIWLLRSSQDIFDPQDIRRSLL